MPVAGGAMRVSHESINKSLFIQARGVLKKELVRNLRSRRLMRRAKTATTEGQPRDRSSAPFRSGSVLPRWRTARCPATGKAT